MTMPVRRHGFTYIEVLLVMAMASILAAIGMPRFFKAQKNAKHSEAITQLKQLHAGMSTQALMPSSIHVPGFNPERGNTYSYHLSGPCTSWEDRSGEVALPNETDDCIGVDTYAHPKLPALFMPELMPSVGWSWEAMMNGMGAFPGIFGSETNWDYLAYAAGDVDKDPNDFADTWAISSSDGHLEGICPYNFAQVPAGEPFLVFDDTEKKCF
jgi:type IV pilus assembly protein PilA